MAFITGVSFDARTGELVITSQDFKAQGESLIPSGEATEARVRLVEPGVAFTVGFDADALIVGVVNKGLVPIHHSEVNLVMPKGEGSMKARFTPEDSLSPTLLPGVKQEWYFRLDQPHFMVGQPIKQFVMSQPPDSFFIALESGGKEIGRIEGALLKSQMGKMGWS